MTKTTLSSGNTLRKLANCIRVLTIDAVEQARSGHPGMPLGMADVATVLFTEFMHFSPSDPKWLNRDRFILSAGHGSMLLYSLLYLTGYADIVLDDLKNFRQLHSKTAGHPEYGLLAGVEATTGPLGQGLANAIGMAIARQLHEAKLAASGVLDHHVYAIAGDGCLMEGISHEACSLAGHLRLKNLTVLYDSNDITIDGSRSLADSHNAKLRFQSYGWHVEEIDGHDFAAIRAALATARASVGPSLIICKTKIAYGAPTKEGTSASHGAPLGEVEVMQAKRAYGWPEDKKFFIPDELLVQWREHGKSTRMQEKYRTWQEKVERLSMEQQRALQQIENLRVREEELTEKIAQLKRQDGSPASMHGMDPRMTVEERVMTDIATREASGKVIAALCNHIPFIGGSADLTESNHTKPSGMHAISHDKWDCNYICYGVREHAMGAIMNGIALYGGLVPYGGSFLVFMDYAKPALRMAALMKLQVIYVMTHDSIGVGEDGPTHQPVEQLGYLRAIPNVNVFRPADSIETFECWELALQARSTPSVICLTRQKVPIVRRAMSRIATSIVFSAHAGIQAPSSAKTEEPGVKYSLDSRLRGGYESGMHESFKENLCARGAYILSEHEGTHQVTILASGSEVSIALDAQRLLHVQNIGTRVVSMPCMTLFDQQDDAYKHELLGGACVMVAIEAAARFGWDRYIGSDGIFIGMNSFGMSAPYKDLYKIFGITPEAVLERVLAKLKETIDA